MKDTFESDLRECLRLSDARKAENEKARLRATVNVQLVDILTEESKRRGMGGAIDWPEYFRNVDIA